MNIEKAISEKQGTIVDVRSPTEFMGGNVPGSVNIPLQELDARMDELKALKQPLILCCASGNRSGMAEQVLTQAGFDCGNGGSWLDVQYYAKQA
jgi:phage shock protein E